MKLQIIFSHDNGQDIANIPYELVDMRSEKSCIHDLKLLFYGKRSFVADNWKEIALSTMTKESTFRIPEELNNVPELVKISMCIITDTDKAPKSPKWYNECNGKIYFN